MKANLDFDLILYGVMLAGLGVLAHLFAPEIGYATPIAGVAGGVLGVSWWSLARFLRRFRACVPQSDYSRFIAVRGPFSRTSFANAVRSV
jgi:hypothetical protein